MVQAYTVAAFCSFHGFPDARPADEGAIGMADISSLLELSVWCISDMFEWPDRPGVKLVKER